MTIINWLNDNSVLISKKLADTIAAFEFHNCGTIDELASEFVKELVKFTKETLQNPDHFYHDDDRPGVIYNLISENCASHELEGAIDKIENDLHEWKIGDELDNLIVEIIACTVESDFLIMLPAEELAKLSLEDQEAYHAKHDRLTEQSQKSFEAFKKEIDRTVIKVSNKPSDGKKPPTLEDLMEGVTPENMHPETDWGRPVGKEIW